MVLRSGQGVLFQTTFRRPGGRASRLITSARGLTSYSVTQNIRFRTRLSAQAAPELAQHTKLSIKTAIGDATHTIPYDTVSKSSAGTSKMHETVNKKSDRRRKTYDSVRDCQQKQRGN